MEPVDDESSSSHNGSILHTLAAGGWFVSLAFGGFVGLFLSLYLLFFTSLWWIVLPYLIWIWLFDREVCERGGRRSEYIRSWRWWKYFQVWIKLVSTAFNIVVQQKCLCLCVLLQNNGE